jgi:mannose-6-phosphate isomerase-like protein (cupin superfamily)
MERKIVARIFNKGFKFVVRADKVVSINLGTAHTTKNPSHFEMRRVE